ncbi:uncharacterized protein LOC125954019 isoform X1 [Anopheles darlingi]|uniref:uncharacterized protein LOC125954019 isoform X1 n=2 Tax=Anopheles darlingi TaxID=43151 RepID=UPI0021005B13|nr:uncharacterized protein LOC125954019 isoform X1 [Anopheles darlingi]
MSSFCIDMALLDDTNGNTAGVHNASSDQTTGEAGILAGTGGSVVAALHSPSSDDLSQSLSEYTDADESISAPTELLAEFLSAIMIRDYVNALRYCKQILEYEPNNATARDFYPHILSKIDAGHTHEQLSCESDENDNCNCNSPLGSSSSSSLRLSRSSSSSNDTESSSTESSFSSSVSSPDSSVSCLVSERIEDPDLVSMACSSDESNSRGPGISLSESGLNTNAQEGKRPNKHAGTQNFSQSRSCRSLDVECDQLPTSVSENNTSQSYSSLILEEEEKDLTLSDLSNPNNEEEKMAKGDSTEKGSLYRSKNQSALQMVSESLASNVSGSASIFASRLMTTLRRKMIASRKEEAPMLNTEPNNFKKQTNSLEGKRK